ncbi:MAG: nicotinate phosphoribosyltransferase [Candidatus Hadarchaeales archaeon]
MEMKFNLASPEEIKKGLTTDIYFVRTKEILEQKGVKVRALAEVTSGRLPRNWPWAVLCGTDEVAALFEGLPVDVYSLPEGTIFTPEDLRGVRVPLLTIEGIYTDYCLYETPMLGFLCHASGVATKAARMRKLVGKKLLIAFGIRRAHPGISPMLDRATYIGGFDGVSSLLGAKTIGKEPMGTMPHALIISLGSQQKAWKAFDELMPEGVPRIALIDTYYDEKAEAIMALETLGKRLYGVRLDTPSSRKGNFAELIREVRWELDLRGGKHVKIVVSGGVDDTNIKELSEAGADAFGVGTSITNAPVLDLAMDIVEIEGKPVAKRGKLGGRKRVWRCEACLGMLVLPHAESQPSCPRCGGRMEESLKPLVLGGKPCKLPSVDEIRERVLSQLEKVSI